MANVVAEEISVAGKTAKKTNVFWSTVPENEQFRNVRVPGVTSRATENNKMNLKVRPQVLVRKSKSEPVVASNRDLLVSGNNRQATGKVTDRKKVPSGRIKDNVQSDLTESMDSLPGGDSRRASIKNLNVEDKKRVANLIKELAKTGEERELALERLQEERVTFEERLSAVQEEQASLRLEKEVLQQKLQHGELQLKKYECDLENLKEYKKNQDLILKKQSAALAQGTQTSPLPKTLTSSSTSPLNAGIQSKPNSGEGHTKFRPNWDVNNNFVPSSVHVTTRSPKGNHVSSDVQQVPVYSNSLFDLKVSKAGQPVKMGRGDASQENVSEESRLHELYLREYKLQLDLQEKQLEIQKQQVVLQQQLNLLHQQQKQTELTKPHLPEQPVYHNAQQTKDVQIQQKQLPDLSRNFANLKLENENNSKPVLQLNQNNMSVNQGNHTTGQKTTRVSQDKVIYKRNLGYSMSKNQMLRNEQDTEYQQSLVHLPTSYHNQSVEDQNYYQNSDYDQAVNHRNVSYNTSHNQSRIEPNGHYDQPSIPLKAYHGNSNDQYHHQHAYSDQPVHQLENNRHNNVGEKYEYHQYDEQRDVQNPRFTPSLHKVTNKKYPGPHNQPFVPPGSMHSSGVQTEKYHKNPPQNQSPDYSWPPSHNDRFTLNEEHCQVAERYNEHKGFKLSQSQHNFGVPSQNNNHYRDSELSHGRNVPSSGYNSGDQRQYHLLPGNPDKHTGMEPQDYLPVPKSSYHDKQHLDQKHYHDESLYHKSQLSSTNHHLPEQQDHSWHYSSIDTHVPHPQEVQPLSSRGAVPSDHHHDYHSDGDQPYNDHPSNTEHCVSEPYGTFRHSHHNQPPGLMDHHHPESYCTKCSGPCSVSYGHEGGKYKQHYSPTRQNGFYGQPTNSLGASHHTILKQNRSNLPHYKSELHPDRPYHQNEQPPQEKRVGFSSVLVNNKLLQPEQGNGPSRHSSFGRSEQGSPQVLQDRYSGRQVPLDRYISHHEQSGRTLQKPLISEENITYKGTPNRKIASKSGRSRQRDPRVQSVTRNGRRQELELGQDEIIDSGYSLYRPNSSPRSPLVSPSHHTSSRPSPSVSRQMQVKTSSQSYPNSLIEFVEDLESSTSEWDKPEPRQERTSFISSDEEENSVLDNIFFLKR